MKRKTIRALIGISTLLLLGLVITQIFWVKRALVIEQKQFGYTVTEALKNVVETIQKHSDDSIYIQAPVRELEDNLFMVRTHDTLHPFYLKSLMQSEFLSADIREDFRFNIYDCFNDSIVYYETVTMSDDQSEKKSQMPDIKWNDDDGHYFSVYFHNRNKSLWSKMEFWVYSSVLVIAVILLFAYNISVILKQKRLSEIKTDFINNMTHEFKTPISTIDLSADVLLKKGIEEKPEKLKKYAQIVKEENTRLQGQVERILQIATLEKENINLKSSKVDMHELLKKAGETFILNVKAKNGKLDLRLNAKKSIVQGDEVHLTNVINNLIDNAVKYSGDKTEITVSTGNINGKLKISIADKGIGIDEKDIDHIFDKFYRVATGDLHNVKGFGIGLNYVKVMIEKHKGSISVESKPGEGSIFHIFLPVPGIVS